METPQGNCIYTASYPGVREAFYSEEDDIMEEEEEAHEPDGGRFHETSKAVNTLRMRFSIGVWTLRLHTHRERDSAFEGQD